MKPVKQDLFPIEENYHIRSNCFAACLASLLELPLREVPHLMAHVDWFELTQAWLEPRKLGLVEVYLGTEEAFLYPLPRGLWLILTGTTTRHSTQLHSVVAKTTGDGVAWEYVHDPHPDNNFLVEAKYLMFLVRLGDVMMTACKPTLETRLETANAVLALITDRVRLLRKESRVYVEFPVWKSGGTFSLVQKPWRSIGGQDFYPTWRRHFSHGGTVTTALANLVRWCRGQPVLPLGMWRYWCGPVVGLGLRPDGSCHGLEVLRLLEEGGYPPKACCILCGLELGRYEWWHLDGVNGPCCVHDEGCRQARKEVER